VASWSYRFVWQPKWLAGHLLVLATVVAMVLLGHWQLTVSDRKHFSLQNFGYALQWWAFSIFAVAFWAKIIHDNATGRGSVGSQQAEPQGGTDEPVAYRRYVMPNRVETGADPVVDAYNAYLASLAEQDGR
jgi:DNA-binding transcriptional regulator of glucitol operon